MMQGRPQKMHISNLPKDANYLHRYIIALPPSNDCLHAYFSNAGDFGTKAGSQS